MFKKLSLALLWLFAMPALAQSTDTVDLSTIGLLNSAMSSALDVISTSLTTTCINWLGAFIGLQMVFTQGSGLLQGVDWDRAWAKFLGGLFWAGICIYIFSNGADFIKGMANYLLNLAAGLSGSPFDPAYPIKVGLDSSTQLLEALDKGRGIFGNLNPFPSIMMGLVCLVILATCAVIAFRLLMISIETKIVIALSPISFALMGLNALRDQGFVPLKYLISMAYRVLILGAVLAAMAKFSAALVPVFNNLPPLSSGGSWAPCWAAAIGYSLLGALAYNSNAIAAQLSSGTSSMTTSDMGGAGAMGAAVAAALGAGVGGALGAATGSKPVQAMADWSKEAFAGNHAGIKNAGEMGSGGLSTSALKPDSPSLSVGGRGGSSSGDMGGNASSDTGAGPGAGDSNTPVAGGQVDSGPGGVITPNSLPDQNARDPARDAARAERRAASAAAKKAGGATDSPAGSGTTAGIGGTGGPGGKGFLDRLSAAHDQAISGPTHTVNVSLNTHHDL